MNSGHSKSQPKKILILSHTAKLGGGEVAILNLLHHFDHERYEITLICGEEGPFLDQVRQLGLRCEVLPLSKRVKNQSKDSLGYSILLKPHLLMSAFGYVRRLRRRIKALQPDLVHTNTLKADLLGGLAARLAGATLVWHVRDRISEDYLPKIVVRYFRQLSRMIPHAIVTNSLASSNAIQGQPEPVFGEPPDTRRRKKAWTGPPIHVVHEGVTMLGGEPLTGGPLPEANGPIFGLVGRISPWKGQHVFVEAASRLNRKYPDARFWIIGASLFQTADRYQQQIAKLIDERNLEDVVHFTGFRDDIYAVIEKLDCLVHASVTGEPFGQVIIQGMATARPVIATAGGGVLEIIDHGRTGLLVEMGSVDAMAQAIEQIILAPADAKQMGQEAQKEVKERFMIQTVVEKIQNIWDVNIKTQGDALPRIPEPGTNHSPSLT
ncbi:MAG: glycosyltransferase [Planctomycetota bacterium]